MSKHIDRAGTYTGVVVESGYGTTAKNDLPQWVCRLQAKKKWAGSPDELAYFKLDGPAYVPWDYDESIIGYLVLFAADGKPLLNYDQVKTATGWTGHDFQDLGALVGKELLFRVEEETYKDKSTLKVSWVDAVDAPAERTLRVLDPAKVKADSQKWLSKGTPAAATASKPKSASAPKPPAASPPASGRVGYPWFADAIVPPPPPAPPPASVPPPPPAPPPASVPPPPPAAKLPEGCTQVEGWAYVNTPAIKGANEDSVVEEAWISASAEVGGSTGYTDHVAQADFTPAMWAKVRDIVAHDLGGAK